MSKKLELQFCRDFDTDCLGFYCKFDNANVIFSPTFDVIDDGPYFITIAISISALWLDSDSQKQVLDLYSENYDLMSNYFQIFLGTECGPILKSAYQSVLNLPLNSDEIKKVQSKLKEFTYIYLIKDQRTGLIKIGKSDDPQARLKTLIKQDTLLPEPNDFKLLSAWSDFAYQERVLHKKFAHKRVRGEWFDLSDLDVMTIRDRFMSEINLVTGISELEEMEITRRDESTRDEDFVS